MCKRYLKLFCLKVWQAQHGVLRRQLPSYLICLFASFIFSRPSIWSAHSSSKIIWCQWTHHRVLKPRFTYAYLINFDMWPTWLYACNCHAKRGSGKRLGRHLMEHLLLVDEVTALFDEPEQLGDVCRPIIQYLKHHSGRVQEQRRRNKSHSIVSTKTK